MEGKVSSEPQPGRARRSAERPKVEPIAESGNLSSEGLPNDLDAERFVLGWVLETGRFGDAAALTPDDFSLDRHKRVFSSAARLESAPGWVRLPWPQ